MPALQAARQDLSGTLRDGTGASGGRANHHVRSTLVVLEIALALALVIGSGLLIRTSLALRAVAPGFDAGERVDDDDVVHGSEVSDVDVGRASDSRRRRSLAHACRASSSRAPSCCVPLQGGYGLPFRDRGQGRFPRDSSFTAAAIGSRCRRDTSRCSRSPCFAAERSPIRDDANAPPVAIINEAMAKEYWKNGDPLNDRLAIGRGGMNEFAAEPDRQIIGIVADSRDNGLNQDPGPKMFVPQAQIPDDVNVAQHAGSRRCRG